MITMTCLILESLLSDDTSPGGGASDVPKEVIERCFVFAAIWGFGGSLSVDKGVDYRKLFSEYWKTTWSDLGIMEVDGWSRILQTLTIMAQFSPRIASLLTLSTL